MKKNTMNDLMKKDCSFIDSFSGIIELPEGITLKYDNGTCIEIRMPKKKNKLSWEPIRI